MLFHITLQLHLTCIFSSQYCALNSRRPFVFCLITGIRDIFHDAKIINCVFSEFNLHLYTSKVPLCIINKPCPMMKITFPNIYSTVASTLGEPISISEEVETINQISKVVNQQPLAGSLQSSTKHFPHLYHLHYRICLLRLFSRPTLSLASIFFHQKDKDPFLFSSY